MKKASIIVSTLTLGVLLLSASCSGKAGDYCDKVKSCEGGNDNDRDACVEAFHAQEDVAGDYDCGDAFDDYTECVIDTAVCTNGKLVTDPCASARAAYGACQQAASGKPKN